MKPILPLFVMIDAAGWEILRANPFAESLVPTRKRLDSVFGYSSACVPSIVSGRWPDQHRNWCFFVHDPAHSPFAGLRPLRWLPEFVTGRRRFRRLLTRFLKVRLGFRGYFDLYNIPFRHIHLFDFTEKRSPLQPGGMNRGPNIFDTLVERNVPYFVSDPALSDEANRDALIGALAAGIPDFAFCYWPSLDGLLHLAGNDSPRVPQRLGEFERWLGDVVRAARTAYRDVHLYVFSDHGMANCDVHLDLRARIDALPLRMGRDYSVVYDSTMARFWFFDERARILVTEALARVPEGRVVPPDELRALRAPFEDGYFGELVFLVREGVLIVPSHMGERPIRAMHGYHPSEPQSHAALLTNRPSLPDDITAIPHIHRLMLRTLALARPDVAWPPEPA